MKRLSIKSRSVLVSWLVSYFLILSLSVIGSSIIYVISTNIISSEVLYSHKIVLEQIQQLLDKRIEDIDRLATQIEMNENVQSVIYIREPMTNENHYRIGRTVNDLIVYRTANAFVDNFYIYLGNLKKVLTPNALYDTTLAYNVFHEKDSLSYSNWIKLINESHSKLFYPLKKRNNGRTTIAYIRSIPNLKIYKPAATLVMLIDENRFQQAINGINISNGINVFILDSNNIILSSNRPISVPEEISYNSLSSPNGQFECFIDDKKYMILFTTSNITHWKYVAMIPITVLNSKPIFIRVITFICLSLISLFGILLSFKFSKRNYNPIDRIVKNLSNYFYTPNINEQNEYRFIENAVNNVIMNKQKIDILYEKQNAFLRDNYLKSLLKGDINYSSPVYDIMSLLDLNFVSDSFVVMLFYIDEYLFNNNQGIADIQYNIEKVAKNYMPGNNKIFTIKMDSMLIFLINLDNIDKDTNYNQICISSDKIQKHLKNELYIDVIISVSRINAGLEGIHMAFNEALELINYKTLLNNKNVIVYRDVEKYIKEKQGYYYPEEEEKKLIYQLHMGDSSNAADIINHIFRVNLIENHMPFSMVKCLTIDMISSVVKAVSTNVNANDELYNELYNDIQVFIERALKSDTFNEIKDILYDIVEKACTIIAKNKRNDTDLLKKIIEYVNQSYMDSDLNVSKVADHLNMNLSYISKYFKDSTGIGLYDYINRIRIEKAKELLKEGNMVLNDVINKVGFNNLNSFIRVFKKYEGITPGMFRTVNTDLKMY